MNSIKENLIKHKISLPEATKPIANYSPYLIINNLVFISGQIPLLKDKLSYQGKVGSDISIADGIEASKICILNTFGVLKAAVKNNTLLIKRCVKITVFINSTNDFIDQPVVADGASNLIHNILGEYGNHTRSAVSANSLPKNASIEIDSIFEIDIER
ncbi:RidA family protein [Pelagibacteraceae bacterium]|nr:RidA family protein [Pelagibacteraceae bacterium]